MTEIKILLEQIFVGIAGLGFFALLAFIPVYIIGTILFIPTVILNLTAGALFGVPVGFAAALTLSLVSASCSFLGGRYLSRGWVSKKVASDKKFMALDNAVAEKGWKIVLLLRLSGVLPFTLLNYGLGLTRISFKNYVLASFVGMILGTLLYVYLGSVAGSMLFKESSVQKTPLELASVVLGFAMTFGMTLYTASIVRKALRTDSVEPTLKK